MKKCISLILAFVFVIGVLITAPLTPTANASEVEGLTFKLNDDGKSYCVSGFTESVSLDLVIPAAYNGLPVTSIGSHAFEDCFALTSVIIPDSVTSIGDFAFYSCVALTSATIPDSVTTIGDGAFYYCVAITSISVPGSVTNIGESAFAYCNALENVTLGSGITGLGVLMFEGCRSLTNITIPDTVTTIGGGAFYECIKLANVTIPEGVTSIGEAAFYYCRDLVSVTVPDSVTEIHETAFAECSSELVFTVNCNEYVIEYLEKNNFNYILNSNDKETLVQINDYIAAVGTKNAVVDTITNTLLLDISASKDINEAIVEMDGYTLNTTQTSDYGFIGTGSKVQVLDGNGTQVAEYTLVVRGDVNGDSICDTLDCMLIELARHEDNNVSLEGVYFTAADLAEDSEININDFNAVVNKAIA